MADRPGRTFEKNHGTDGVVVMAYMDFKKTTSGWAVYYEDLLTGVIAPCACCDDLLFKPEIGENFPPQCLAEISEFMFQNMAERMAGGDK